MCIRSSPSLQNLWHAFGGWLSFILWLLCAFEMNFIILLTQSLTQSSLCRLVLEASTRDYLVSSFILTILAQQWLMYLVICVGIKLPTLFLKTHWKFTGLGIGNEFFVTITLKFKSVKESYLFTAINLMRKEL